MGFVIEYQIERWILKKPPDQIGKPAKSDFAAQTENQLLAILEKDRDVFGADRSQLLRSLHSENPDLTIGVSDQDILRGYALGRRGSFADHLGPWMAESWTAAEKLIHEFLARSSRQTIIVACLAENSFAMKLHRECQFVRSRSLTRMYRGPNASPGIPTRSAQFWAQNSDEISHRIRVCFASEF